jgi:hypothetical protein
MNIQKIILSNNIILLLLRLKVWNSYNIYNRINIKYIEKTKKNFFLKKISERKKN